MEIRKLIGLSLFFLLVLSLFVLAAGSSSRSSSYDDEMQFPKSTHSANTAEGKTTVPLARESTDNCDSMPILKGRIECRLSSGEENEGIPEACRGTLDADGCYQLNEAAHPCYYLNGIEKDQCLRKVSGLTLQQGQTQLRNYLAFLFYDLEERVEEAFEDKKISTADASELITRITEIKKDILSNAPKFDLENDITVFKEHWEEVMG